MCSSRSARQRVRSNLKVQKLPPGPLPPFDVPHEVRPVIRPDSTSFPAGVRIVDAAVEPARVEAEWIRDVQRDPLLRLRIQDEQRIGVRSGGHRHVLAETERVVLIDPVVIMKFGGNVGPLQLRTRGLIERPALRALVPFFYVRAAEDLALPAIEAGQMAARGERPPDPAVASDVDAA